MRWLGVLLLLGGCQQPWDDSAEDAAKLRLEIAQLQTEIQRLKAEDEAHERELIMVAEAHDELAEQVADNAAAYNRHTH